MDDAAAWLVLAFQLVVLPVVAGYVAYRVIGGTTGKIAALAAGAIVAVFFVMNVDVPGK